MFNDFRNMDYGKDIIISKFIVDTEDLDDYITEDVWKVEKDGRFVHIIKMKSL